MRVTEEMRAAGVEVLNGQYGEITTFEDWNTPNVAEAVFTAMFDARLGALNRRCQQAHVRVEAALAAIPKGDALPTEEAKAELHAAIDAFNAEATILGNAIENWRDQPD